MYPFCPSHYEKEFRNISSQLAFKKNADTEEAWLHVVVTKDLVLTASLNFLFELDPLCPLEKHSHIFKEMSLKILEFHRFAIV